jgi:hypothetical protein
VRPISAKAFGIFLGFVAGLVITLIIGILDVWYGVK